MKTHTFSLLTVAILVGCDPVPSQAPANQPAPPLQATPTPAPEIIATKYWHDATTEAFLEMRIVAKDADSARVALRAVHDAAWMKRPNPASVGASGATKPVNHFQAWAYPSAESYWRGDLPFARIHHMGEGSEIELH